MAGSVVPKPCDSSPKAENSSLKAGSPASKAGNSSPKVGDSDLKAGSSVAKSENPSLKAGSPPQKAANSSPKAADSNEKAGASPAKDGNSGLKAGAPPQKACASAAKDGNSSLKAGSPPQKACASAARDGNSSLKVCTPPQKAGNSSPKAGDSNEKAGASAAKAGNSSPKAGASDPKTGNSGPKAGNGRGVLGKAACAVPVPAKAGSGKGASKPADPRALARGGAGPVRACRRGTCVSELLKVFSHDDRVLIIITADPDSIASAVALKRLLWRRVAHVHICSTNEVRRPDNLRLLKSLELNLPLLAKEDVSRYTRLAMVDGQPSHSPQTAELPFWVVVDHHPRCHRGPGVPGPAFEDIRPETGATSTLFTDYLRAARIRPNRILATALFYGIKTDTQNFVRRGREEDMRAFQWLYPFIHQPLLSDIERAPVDRSAFEVIKRALTLMSFRKQYAFVFVEELDHADTLVIVADFVMQIEGVTRAVISGVFEDRLVVVLRSGGIRGNLGALAARAFGEFGSAGGHKNMARAEMKLADLDPRLHGKPQSLARFVLKRLAVALGHSRRRHPDRGESHAGHEAEHRERKGNRDLMALQPKPPKMQKQPEPPKAQK
jgi:nanoRNase/pAp phosphatase (c-di-AMP/oligoRNAs hydrolase)